MKAIVRTIRDFKSLLDVAIVTTPIALDGLVPQESMRRRNQTSAWKQARYQQKDMDMLPKL